MSGNDSNKDTRVFSADIKQLLHLIINSFYSDKEIFLRELISNSSDALEKLRVVKMTENVMLDNLEINIIQDTEKQCLIIQDNGIGMSKEELINNIGTIAKSGTKLFSDKLNDSASIQSLIGQFGVGFYSGFLVANKIELYSKSFNETQGYKWSCEGDTEYKIEECADLETGTKIILHLKDECIEYLQMPILKSLIKKYSDFIKYPIKLQYKLQEPEEKKENEQGQEYTVEVVNTQLPIWAKNKEELSDKDYSDFYKQFINQLGKHGVVSDSFITFRHFKVEGDITYKVLLYIPENVTNLFKENNGNAIKIYNKHIFVTDNNWKFLPEYLSCFYGIIDCEDLPLNASRELLQNTQSMKSFQKSLTKKCIDMLIELSEDKDKYLKFYQKYSKVIKYGIHLDESNKSKLSKLLRYNTVNNVKNGLFIGLDEYVSKMASEQKDIYYINGENSIELSKSPLLEGFLTKGYDILLMNDPLDEYVINSLHSYGGKQLKSVTNDNIPLNLDESNKHKMDKSQLDMVALCTCILKILKDKVTNVIESKRLINYPCCLTNSKSWSWSPHMEKVMKYQALGDNTNLLKPSRILELNSNHKIIKYLYDIRDEPHFSLYVKGLYTMSSLSSGFIIDDNITSGNELFNMFESFLSINNSKQDVKDDVKQEVKDDVKQEVKDDVKEEVKDDVKDEVKEEVKDDVKEKVKDDVKEIAIDIKEVTVDDLKGDEVITNIECNDTGCFVKYKNTGENDTDDDKKLNEEMGTCEHYDSDSETGDLDVDN